eukprot:265087-Amphidinium_carterae.1
MGVLLVYAYASREAPGAHNSRIGGMGTLELHSDPKACYRHLVVCVFHLELLQSSQQSVVSRLAYFFSPLCARFPYTGARTLIGASSSLHLVEDDFTINRRLSVWFSVAR